MRFVGPGIGAVALMVAGSVAAQQANVHGSPPDQLPQATAAVVPSGKVVPLPKPSASIEVVGAPSSADTLCPGAGALPTEDARALVVHVAGEEGFYPDIVVSVAKAESRFASTAMSDKGAYGLMQLTPETAQRFKVDLCKPAENVRGGVRFLRFLRERYPNPLYMLAAYNAGEQALIDHRGVPPFPETVRFVAEVMNDFYGWPRVSAAATKPADVAVVDFTRIQDLQNVSRPKPSAPAPPANPNASKEAPWSDGFVMHVE
jgi:hypothetical protein